MYKFKVLHVKIFSESIHILVSRLKCNDKEYINFSAKIPNFFVEYLIVVIEIFKHKENLWLTE